MYGQFSLRSHLYPTDTYNLALSRHFLLLFIRRIPSTSFPGLFPLENRNKPGNEDGITLQEGQVPVPTVSFLEKVNSKVG